MNAATQELPTVTLRPPSDLQHDKRKDNWTLEEDVPLGDGEIVLRLDPFLKKDELHIGGDAILERAKEMGSLAGQRHAERLFNQPDAIPEEWRDFVLVFPGTRWRDPFGHLHVPCLSRSRYGSEWRLYFHWLYRDFAFLTRFVRLGK